MKFFTFILLGTLPFLVACGGTENSTNESSQTNYQHYTREFQTMQGCLNFVKSEAQNAGMSLKISGDKPGKVTGSFNGDSAMFFHCKKRESGTNGTFFEAAYPKFN
ncbi:hypothetical protein [Psychrobacter frigidicola]|uniref:hypothetical protein n=1 Tax=Psychrobacter frigidicola TaxID=45611 RepID=UPI0019183087|nr:hypothetical protein [Psychrobacter frigidicola]